MNLLHRNSAGVILSRLITGIVIIISAVEGVVRCDTGPSDESGGKESSRGVYFRQVESW